MCVFLFLHISFDKTITYKYKAEQACFVRSILLMLVFLCKVLKLNKCFHFTKT